MSHAGYATCRAVAHLPPAKRRQLRAITDIIRAAADVEHVLPYRRERPRILRAAQGRLTGPWRAP